MGRRRVDRLEGGHPARVYDRRPNMFWGFLPEAGYVEGDLGNHGLIREAV